MLDAIEEPLDAVAQLIDARAERRRVETMIQRTDIGVGALAGNLGPQSVAVVAAISQHDAVAGKRDQHVLAALAVRSLSGCQLERNRETVGIDDGVDFGRKPAAGAAHAITSTAFFSPLAACWCTRTTELSII